MGSVYVQITGHDALLRRLKELRDVDTADTMQAIAEGLRTSTVERFGVTISPEGKKWRTSIRARETGGKTLTKTANLKNSIRAESDATGLAIGTNSIYAATHQFGDKRVIRPKRAKVLRWQMNGRWISKKKVQVDIPARPFLGISEEDANEIQDMLDEMIRG